MRWKDSLTEEPYGQHRGWIQPFSFEQPRAKGAEKSRHPCHLTLICVIGEVWGLPPS